jgi:hypothetical protein
MKRIHHILIATTLMIMGTEAFAQAPDRSHFEMLTTQQYQNDSFGIAAPKSERIIILDKRSGQLWAWSQISQSIIYLG